MTPDVGDWRIATLTVDPADETTVVVLTVVAPDGTETTPAVAPGEDGPATWESEPYVLDQPGEWVERWAVTGTGAGAQRAVVRVAPDPTATPGARVYATTGDYASWLGSAPPAGARRALAAASRVVDELLLTACYATDAEGMPTDPKVVDALKQATCAQAAYQAAVGDPAGIGAGHISQASIGSISFTRAAAGTTGGQAPGRYSPQAVQILRSAGLLGTGPLLAGEVFS